MQSLAETEFQSQQKQADGIWGQAQELRNKGPDVRELDRQFTEQFQAQYQQIESFDHDAEARLNDLGSKVDALETEKAAALKELAEGEFCSLCRRTKTEIEMEEHESFAAHLSRVQGEAVPATQEEIAQRAYDYDLKIADASRAYDDERSQDTARDTDLRNQILQLQSQYRAQRLQIIADWEKQVSSLEDQAREVLTTAQNKYRQALQQVQQCKLAQR